jgi:hypothetical protein
MGVLWLVLFRKERGPVIFSTLEFEDSWVTRDALKMLVWRLQEGLNSSLGAL